LNGASGEVTCLAFTRDGKFLVSGSYNDYTVKVWKIGTYTKTTINVQVNVGGGKVEKEVKEEFQYEVDPSLITTKKNKDRIKDLCITPDARTVITSDAYQNLVFRSLDPEGDLNEGETIATQLGHELHLAISPNGKLLATCSFDKVVSLWDTASRKKIQE